MPFAAVYEYLHTSIANKHKGDARSTSTTLSEQLSTRLDFNDQRIAAPQLVILSGDDEAGTCLVANRVVASLAAKYKCNHPHHPPLMVVKLADAFASYKPAIRQIARQLLDQHTPAARMRIKKQKSKCQPTKKRKFSQLPSKTSLEVCEQLVKDTLQREGGLLLVLNDIESFAKCGKSGILCKLLKLSQNATMQVKVLGLTQQDRLQDSLAEEGITSLCSVLSLGHSEVCNQHAVVAGESAANILATMLLVPEEQFHQAAQTWNAAVQHEVGSLTGANMPSSVMRAASEGELTCTQLKLIALTVVNKAAHRHSVVQQADVIHEMMEIISEPCQVPSTLTHNCSELQAAMLAAVFRHNVVYKDKHVFNFETVYQAFQPLRHAFNPQHRCSKEQAWAAFSSLMNLLLVTTTEKGLEAIALHPPDHRKLITIIDTSEAQAIISAASTSANLHKRILKYCPKLSEKLEGLA